MLPPHPQVLSIIHILIMLMHALAHLRVVDHQTGQGRNGLMNYIYHFLGFDITHSHNFIKYFIKII